MVEAESVTIDDLPPVPFTAGQEEITLSADAVAGLWTLRFGPFGCRDNETHGGVLHIEGDRMAGGDGHLVFHGRFTPVDGALDISVQVVRHSAGSAYAGIFGEVDPVFRLDFLAEAISPDLLEGRIPRTGGADIRIVMRRFKMLSAGSLLV